MLARLILACPPCSHSHSPFSSAFSSSHYPPAVYYPRPIPIRFAVCRGCVQVALSADCWCWNGVRLMEGNGDCDGGSVMEDEIGSMLEDQTGRMKRQIGNVSISEGSSDGECDCSQWKVGTIVLSSLFGVVILINTACCIGAYIIAGRADAIYGGSHRLCR